jgi:prophage tail gpP-like protein
MPKPSEVATLIVNGVTFTDWESVQVSHSIREAPSYKARFTCSEPTPITPKLNLGKMQIRPGDVCYIELGGFPAMAGKIETRQVYYDANRHHIEIQAATWNELTTASIIHQTMEWPKGSTFAQVAGDVLKPFGVNLSFEGGAPPSTPFDFKPRATHGETPYNFIDTLGRSVATGPFGIAFTSNLQGDFVVLTGPSGGTDSVVEGITILEGREIIYNPSMAGSAPVITQGAPTDEKHGAEAASKGFSQSTFATFGASGNPGVVFSEMPILQQMAIQGRSNAERAWQTEDQITVFATVYGWQKPSGGLWKRDQNVSVVSPMLIMQGDVLILKKVTFSQDDRTGTRSILELCNNQALSQSPVISKPE